MPYYKTTNNELFFLDSENDEHFLPKGLTKITDSQAQAIINTPEKIKADTNAPILAAIAVLESEITPRVWREYLTKPTAAGKRGLTPAALIADVDTKIAALRAQLV